MPILKMRSTLGSSVPCHHNVFSTGLKGATCIVKRHRTVRVYEDSADTATCSTVACRADHLQELGSRRTRRASPIVRAASSSTTAVGSEPREVYPGVFEEYWIWKGHKIRFQRSGDKGPALLLVHGFGGNADHWRKNTPDLAKRGFRVFAIDLLGYGYSDKPNPRNAPQNSIYCFPNWGVQLSDFISEVVGAPTCIITNSVGGLAGLEASLVAQRGQVTGVQLIDISLRGLHVKRTNPLLRPFVASFQRLLKETDLGKAFFGSVAKPQTVRNILREAYGVKEAVTEELVDKILSPGLQPGAVDVFLDFITYSGGPLPEDLIAVTPVPVSILWGEKDPWEDIRQGRALFGSLPAVTEFIPLPGVGHCPQDEAPEVVNPLIEKFARACASGQSKGGAGAQTAVVAVEGA